MSEAKRYFLTPEEFEAEYEQRRAEAIAKLQKPKPNEPFNASVNYQLKPRAKYVPNLLDSTGYPGQIVYCRPVVQRIAAVSELAEGGPETAAGLLNGHISSPDVFNPFNKGHIDFWDGAV